MGWAKIVAAMDKPAPEAVALVFKAALSIKNAMERVETLRDMPEWHQFCDKFGDEAFKAVARRRACRMMEARR